jgi:hypothetical protein
MKDDDAKRIWRRWCVGWEKRLVSPAMKEEEKTTDYLLELEGIE